MEVNESELKAKYGKVHKIEVEVEEGDLVVGYLKRPDIKTYSAAISLLDKDPIKANEVLLKNCLIEEVSDKRILTDSDCFIAILSELPGFLKSATASIKKI